ncbi:MHC_I C-terminus family protein [Ectocarpus siliculosus]|uniref:MHC_I C-terminus family protein n=1 Tax=Ectocarpus siliculosus TaxID=2880 RepID=D8LD22_ECTSI|nr:MHC_I C-terminus family protein [Ectocarpus siliculosus]|eukprot:CBN78389.1 MHC_I C-terminus family protein [Ectocarpus siliculosus]
MASAAASQQSQDRTRVDGFEVEIFKLVQREATSKQWKEWLRAPLEHAAASGNLGLFTRLMDAGASAEAGWRGCDGRTLLGAAACSKNKKILRALLTAGAKSDVNVLFGAKRESALHLAAARGAEEASKALMIAGANPNLRGGRKQSPLHLAATAGHDRVIGILLLKGADVDAKTRAGDTSLHLAASKGHKLCIAELLLGGADKDVSDKGNKTPLFKAAENNHLGAVEELLAAGATRGRTHNGDDSPLEIAANRGHATIVKAFLDTDTSLVNATDHYGYTALHHAALIEVHGRDKGDAVRVLLAAGADVHAKTTDDHLRCAPLHIAVCGRVPSTGTIRALLEGGADVNVRDIEDRTPLHEACTYSSVAAVELLLRWGADEKLTDDGDVTPADMIGTSGDVGSDHGDIEADGQRIHQMLARAPADRSWRRRSWLVLSRSCPTRVKIANENRSGSSVGSSSSSNGNSTKLARFSGEDSGGGERETEDQMMVDLRGLVTRLVGLEADGLFRLVVGFLKRGRNGVLFTSLPQLSDSSRQALATKLVLW